MRDLFRLIGWAVVDLLRSRAALEAEIWTLRQQINVLRRTAPKRLSFSVFDRLVFVCLYRLFPKICDALAIVKPDTIVGWHRYGEAERAAVPRREHLPPQSCRRHRGDGSVRRSDDLVSFALRPIDHGAWPAADSMVWRYTASDRGMDRKSAHGSLWLGTSSPLSNPRSGWGLWRGLHPTASINGYSRSTDV